MEENCRERRTEGEVEAWMCLEQRKELARGSGFTGRHSQQGYHAVVDDAQRRHAVAHLGCGNEITAARWLGCVNEARRLRLMAGIARWLLGAVRHGGATGTVAGRQRQAVASHCGGKLL
ncbi:hypothetical protein SESBI_30563 [Sesbania bispinosa]|nr:hypothetical protein SESBI_30563 [Sesbania bispinosa]